MGVDKTQFEYDHESTRKIKPKGYSKNVVIALSLVIAALLMLLITFIVLYVQDSQANSSPTSPLPVDTITTLSTRSPTAEPTSITVTTSVLTDAPSTFTTVTTPAPTDRPTTPDTSPSTVESTTVTVTTPAPTDRPTTPDTSPSTVESTTVTVTSPAPTDRPLVTECTTDGCKAAAASLKKSMNLDVEPCDNFYEFACGRWNETEKIPDGQGRWDVFGILERELSQTLLALLNVTHPVGAQLNATEKMQKYFQSCVNEEAINDDANMDILLSHIQEIFPEFSSFPWINMATAPTGNESFAAVARARKYGLTMGLFNNYISSDFENPRDNIIYFAPSALGMNPSYYLKENGTELVAYKQYLVDMFFLFGEKAKPGILTKQDAELFANQIIAFEKLLANVGFGRQKDTSDDASINRITLKQFADIYTSKIGIDESYLVNYFRDAFDNTEVNAKLSENTTIFVIDTLYYEVLTNYLSDLQSNDTTLQVQSRYLFANYLVWQIGQAYIERLGEDFRNISRTFRSALTGINRSAPRWEFCIDSVGTEFPEAVGRLYVDQNFEKPTKQRLQTMVDYLFGAFREIVQESDWMTNETRKAALHKAENFAVLIGYDDYIVDDTDRLNREHEELRVTESYLQNGISRRNWITKFEGLSLLNQTLSTTWIVGPAVVNAFYAPSLNSISFPAGILQPPFLGKDYPDYWNYGAIGTVIGHELTHGFDTTGSQFDADGRYRNWWDAISRRNFLERTRDLITQYDGYYLMGQKLNGVQTQGENIADNGGLKEAFFAYRRFIEVERNGTAEDPLPGLNYTSEQMFFLANAQNWCSQFKPEELAYQIANGAHTPGPYRVIGPMQNFQEFANAFSCPVGSYMNPVKKNAVWKVKAEILAKEQ